MPISRASRLLIPLPCLIVLYILPDFGEIVLHPIRITIVNDFEQFLQLAAYLRHLVMSVGIEQYFLEQVVVLA